MEFRNIWKGYVPPFESKFWYKSPVGFNSQKCKYSILHIFFRFCSHTCFAVFCTDALYPHYLTVLPLWQQCDSVFQFYFLTTHSFGHWKATILTKYQTNYTTQIVERTALNSSTKSKRTVCILLPTWAIFYIVINNGHNQVIHLSKSSIRGGCSFFHLNSPEPANTIPPSKFAILHCSNIHK